MTERFHFMNTFNFARFHFLRPLVIYVSFGLGLKILWEQCKSWKTAVNFLIICQVILLSCYNDELIYQKNRQLKNSMQKINFKRLKIIFTDQ